MADTLNVGVLDSRIRILLGLACVGIIGYHYFVRPLLSVYTLGLVALLVLYFLKTGATRNCPIMEMMGVSTNKAPDA